MNEVKQVIRRFLVLFLVLAMVLPLLPQMSIKVHAAVSGTLTGLSNEDIIATYTGTDDGANSSWSVTGENSISGSVKGTAGMCSDSHYNTTLTLTNNKPTAAILSFDYAIAQNSGSIQVAGTTVTANGSYSETIDAGSSINIYIGSGSTDNATEIDITNLFLIADVQATTTFQPSENGSYMVDGVQITEETVKTQQSTIAYALSATANAGYKFVGWYSVTDDKYLSSDEEASLYIDSDQTITAKFTEESNPVFDVGGAKFTDLNEADNYASSNGIEKITLVSDGILASGDYTISDGVILLIPFDDAYTCYTTAPATTGNVRTSPSVYKRLTMDEGASITVNGAISVSAKHYAYSQGGAAGAPDGKYGYIFMNEGSSITINNGGAFYVYGFVSGDGTVTAKSGATVYENMQIADFRGGSATMGMYNNAQKIFPLNQYFVQNIEAKLILESGADEYIYTSIYASNMSTSTAVHFIGNTDAMFSVGEGGTFTKEYLPDQDRLEVTVNGDARINSLTLSLSGMSVTSANYVLPINNCMTLNVASGTTQITQDVALLAGSRLNIADGAAVLVTQGSSLYVYDSDEWTQANYASNAKFKRVPYSPTRTYTRTNSDLIDVKIDLNGMLLSDGAVYTTTGGADIVSSNGTGKFVLTNGAGTNTATYMYKDYTTNYDTIPITSAKLHNSSQYTGTDEEYTLTDGAEAGSTYIYDSNAGKWKLEGETEETYTVTWVNDGGTVLETDENVAYGTMPEYNGETPVKEGDAQYSYTFTGWPPELSKVTADITYKAVYEQTVNEYTVTWKNWDGTVLAEKLVPYGTVPTYSGEQPVREGDAEHSYTFSGWTPEITAVTGDADYTALFTENINTYTVIWQNWDGTELEKDENVSYGTTPEYNGETPAREGDAQYTYTFTGWSPVVDTVTGNITYTAVFSQTVNQYTITWMNGEKVLKTEQVAYGETPVYSGETPVKEDDAKYTYTFTGWDPEIVPVTGNAAYTAQFSAAEKTFTVTWVNDDGTVLETDEDVTYGTTPEYNGSTPTKEADGEFSYEFSGWTPEIAPVTQDITYIAAYEKTPLIWHTVTFDANGGEGSMEPQEVAQGVDTTLNKNSFTRENYQFTGWNTSADGTGASYADEGALINLTEDITLYAQWKIVNGLYHDGDDIYWMQDGEIAKDAGLVRIVLDSGEVNYYYFGEDGKAYKATAEQKYFVVKKNNGLELPEGINYEFGADGVIRHFDDTSINGIYNDTASDNYYYCIDGVIIANGLMQIDGNYYYARTSTGAFVTNQSYWITKTNGLLDEGIYQFDEKGKIIFPEEGEKKDGIVEENGSLYYYVDGVLTGAGLIQIDGDYYYVKTSTGEVVHGRSYWITATNELLPSGVYTFADDGKMVNPPDPDQPGTEKKNGIVEENGSLYYYVDGVLTGAGLIQIDGDYYYVKTSTGEVVHGRTYWITATNDLLPSALYTFADDGKLIQQQD